MEYLDFTNAAIKKKTYGGANGSKLSIVFNGTQYMLKLPPIAKKNPEMSYTNGCISEYLGSHILQSLGIDAQETLLGSYSVNGKTKVCVACKDFAINGWVVQDFASMKNQVVDSERHGYGTELESILYTIENQMSVDPQELKEYFWDMFIADALIGNMDRHNGNWGFLYNAETDQVRYAPLWDQGSSLYPQADEDLIYKILNDDDELYKRIYVFPNSAITIDNKKINYYDFISSGQSDDCSSALVRINERIDIAQINKIIDDTPFISDLQKTFYKTMVLARKELIIEDSIKALGLNQEYEIGKEM